MIFSIIETFSKVGYMTEQVGIFIRSSNDFQFPQGIWLL